MMIKKRTLLALLFCMVTKSYSMSIAFRVACAGYKGTKALVRYSMPTLKKIASQPFAQNMIKFAKENPKQAAYTSIGGLIGYSTSGDGVINTVTGTTLGAVAGFHCAGAHLVKIAHLEKLVCVTATEAALARSQLQNALAQVVKQESLVKMAQASLVTARSAVVNVQAQVTLLKQAAVRTSPLQRLQLAGTKTIEKASNVFGNLKMNFLLGKNAFVVAV